MHCEKEQSVRIESKAAALIKTKGSRTAERGNRWKRKWLHCCLQRPWQCLWQPVGIHPKQEVLQKRQPVKETQYDVDHFIPWSFVMNDELWNLMPMDSSLNSAKSNRLPKWNPFFEVFAGNQYLMYEMINERPDLHKRFEACYRDNLHSIWAGQELYRKGNSREVFYNILERNMMPVYDSARRQGYEIWNYG